MKFLLCIFLIIAGVALETHASPSIPLQNSSDTTITFETEVERLLNTGNLSELKGICITTCVFVKFEYDSKGHIGAVQCNVTTTPALTHFIISAVKSANEKSPVLFKGKRMAGKTFVLPVVVQLSDGRCVPKDDTGSSVYSMLKFVEEPQDPSGLNIRKLNDPLACTILNPIFFGTIH